MSIPVGPEFDEVDGNSNKLIQERIDHFGPDLPAVVTEALRTVPDPLCWQFGKERGRLQVCLRTPPAHLAHCLEQHGTKLGHTHVQAVLEILLRVNENERSMFPVTELNLTGQALGDDGFDKLCDCALDLGRGCCMETLSLAACGISSDGPQCIISRLQWCEPLCLSLKSLDLSHNPGIVLRAGTLPSTLVWHNLLDALRGLQVLDIRHTGFSAQDVMTLLRYVLKVPKLPPLALQVLKVGPLEDAGAPASHSTLLDMRQVLSEVVKTTGLRTLVVQGLDKERAVTLFGEREDEVAHERVGEAAEAREGAQAHGLDGEVAQEREGDGAAVEQPLAQLRWSVRGDVRTCYASFATVEGAQEPVVSDDECPVTAIKFELPKEQLVPATFFNGGDRVERGGPPQRQLAHMQEVLQDSQPVMPWSPRARAAAPPDPLAAEVPFQKQRRKGRRAPGEAGVAKKQPRKRGRSQEAGPREQLHEAGPVADDGHDLGAEDDEGWRDDEADEYEEDDFVRNDDEIVMDTDCDDDDELKEEQLQLARATNDDLRSRRVRQDNEGSSNESGSLGRAHRSAGRAAVPSAHGVDEPAAFNRGRARDAATPVADVDDDPDELNRSLDRPRRSSMPNAGANDDPDGVADHPKRARRASMPSGGTQQRRQAQCEEPRTQRSIKRRLSQAPLVDCEAVVVDDEDDDELASQAERSQDLDDVGVAGPSTSAGRRDKAAGRSGAQRPAGGSHRAELSDTVAPEMDVDEPQQRPPPQGRRNREADDLRPWANDKARDQHKPGNIFEELPAQPGGRAMRRRTAAVQGPEQAAPRQYDAIGSDDDDASSMDTGSSRDPASDRPYARSGDRMSDPPDTRNNALSSNPPDVSARSRDRSHNSGGHTSDDRDSAAFSGRRGSGSAEAFDRHATSVSDRSAGRPGGSGRRLNSSGRRCAERDCDMDGRQDSDSKGGTATVPTRTSDPPQPSAPSEDDHSESEPVIVQRRRSGRERPQNEDDDELFAEPPDAEPVTSQGDHQRHASAIGLSKLRIDDGGQPHVDGPDSDRVIPQSKRGGEKNVPDIGESDQQGTGGAQPPVDDSDSDIVIPQSRRSGKKRPQGIGESEPQDEDGTGQPPPVDGSDSDVIPHRKRGGNKRLSGIGESESEDENGGPLLMDHEPPPPARSWAAMSTVSAAIPTHRRRGAAEQQQAAVHHAAAPLRQAAASSNNHDPVQVVLQLREHLRALDVEIAPLKALHSGGASALLPGVGSSASESDSAAPQGGAANAEELLLPSPEDTARLAELEKERKKLTTRLRHMTALLPPFAWDKLQAEHPVNPNKIVPQDQKRVSRPPTRFTAEAADEKAGQEEVWEQIDQFNLEPHAQATDAGPSRRPQKQRVGRPAAAAAAAAVASPSAQDHESDSDDLPLDSLVKDSDSDDEMPLDVLAKIPTSGDRPHVSDVDGGSRQAARDGRDGVSPHSEGLLTNALLARGASVVPSPHRPSAPSASPIQIGALSVTVPSVGVTAAVPLPRPQAVETAVDISRRATGVSPQRSAPDSDQAFPWSPQQAKSSDADMGHEEAAAVAAAADAVVTQGHAGSQPTAFETPESAVASAASPPVADGGRTALEAAVWTASLPAPAGTVPLMPAAVPQSSPVAPRASVAPSASCGSPEHASFGDEASLAAQSTPNALQQPGGVVPTQAEAQPQAGVAPAMQGLAVVSVPIVQLHASVSPSVAPSTSTDTAAQRARATTSAGRHSPSACPAAPQASVSAVPRCDLPANVRQADHVNAGPPAAAGPWRTVLVAAPPSAPPMPQLSERLPASALLTVTADGVQPAVVASAAVVADPLMGQQAVPSGADAPAPARYAPALPLSSSGRAGLQLSSSGRADSLLPAMGAVPAIAQPSASQPPALILPIVTSAPVDVQASACAPPDLSIPIVMTSASAYQAAMSTPACGAATSPPQFAVFTLPQAAVLSLPCDPVTAAATADGYESDNEVIPSSQTESE